MTFEETINHYGYNVWLSTLTRPKLKRVKIISTMFEAPGFVIYMVEEPDGLRIPVRMVRDNPNRNFDRWVES